jgi:hypothetical protein
MACWNTESVAPCAQPIQAFRYLFRPLIHSGQQYFVWLTSPNATGTRTTRDQGADTFIDAADTFLPFLQRNPTRRLMHLCIQADAAW